MGNILNKLKNKIMKNRGYNKLPSIEQLDKDMEEILKEMEELNRYMEQHISRMNYLYSNTF